jgi:hypothetical protein
MTNVEHVIIGLDSEFVEYAKREHARRKLDGPFRGGSFRPAASPLVTQPAKLIMGAAS